MRFGVTVAGGCNGNASTNQPILTYPEGILLGYNNTLYVGNASGKFLVFELNNRAGRILTSFSGQPARLSLYENTSNIYLTVPDVNLAYIWPTNQIIPPNGISYNNCSMEWLSHPNGIAVDSVGNVYISSLPCNWVTKWAPNATTGTLAAGSPIGAAGSDNQSLDVPRDLAIDETNSFMYVSDGNNNRIQRFVLGGSGIGVTVAGGNGPGFANNQLNTPRGIFLSRVDGSLYIADTSNHRIQKWESNATFGITIAGSSTGIAGNASYLLNQPIDLAIDDEENYLYVSDSTNNRIQRFSLH